MLSLFPLIVLAALAVGMVALQIFLSQRESKWPGLVLPALSLLFSLVFPINMAVSAEGVTAGLIAQMVVVWLLANIPTAILLAIWLACRKKRRTQEME